MKLFLASASEARRAMLRAAGIPFEPGVAEIDEAGLRDRLLADGVVPRAIATALATAKAESVAPSPDTLVLGADQVLETADGALLTKSGSRDEAFHQLRSLSGRTHFLHSAACLAESGSSVWEASESVAMHVRSLSDSFLQAYLDQEYEAVRWNVGAYRIEGPGVQLFDRIDGSHFAILGLPLLPLLAALRERGVLES